MNLSRSTGVVIVLVDLATVVDASTGGPGVLVKFGGAQGRVLEATVVDAVGRRTRSGRAAASVGQTPEFRPSLCRYRLRKHATRH